MQITVEVDCNEKTCGNCPMIDKHPNMEFLSRCIAFREYMDLDRNNNPIRLSECIKSQI